MSVMVLGLASGEWTAKRSAAAWARCRIYLDATGLSTNTIVMYSTDNGWFLGDLGLYDKRFMYEPALNVPLLARGPGIKAGVTRRNSSSTSTSPTCYYHSSGHHNTVSQ